MQKIHTRNRKQTRADAVKSTHLKPSCHRTGTTTAPRPTPECDLRYQRCTKNHQESSQNKQEHHSPTKRNVVACPSDEPGLSSHWPQSGGQPAHLSLLTSTGSGKPDLKHLFQEPLFFFFFFGVFVCELESGWITLDLRLKKYSAQNSPIALLIL